MAGQPVELSIVTSIFGSARHLEEFHARCTTAASALTDSYEIVLVNDGSADDSLRVALDIHRRDPRVRVIDLSRNFGHHKALMTGLAYSRGDLVFLIDSDLDSLATFVVASMRGVTQVYAINASAKTRTLDTQKLMQLCEAMVDGLVVPG